ncbi:5,10-methylenetetrahydrofolate reductase [Saccharomonospora marina XMU15]|uniref:Methylenetetrahydrofolate reductase n=1 Tax=Saccharomonospora marina XMU15 TaxID=882083 RepID=H5X1S8_9PSEU|nr:methylenetetrahydrofolate reductase [Saccharomonospora marina]EHR50941.1 5,10-methylenetetrahydrofolate reductase [Saccharomonospora marina XMU15]
MSLGRAFAAGRFAVTAELGPPRGADPGQVEARARVLRGRVDAVNVTDNPGATVRMSSLAAAVLVLRAGVEPVMQLTGRDRNRMAVQADLLGAGALGIPNVLLLAGDPPGGQAVPVFDLDSVQLLWTARTLRDRGRLLSGSRVDPPPHWRIGSVENPFVPTVRERAARLGTKIAAGAEFVQTQFVFDVAGFARWMAQVRALGLHERCRILAGVGYPRSPAMLHHLRTGLPGVRVPDEVADRLLGVPPHRFRQEGLRLCTEIIDRVREIEGVAGVHVMAFGDEAAAVEIVERAGLTG